MKIKAEKLSEASKVKRQVVDGQLALWNLRLETLVSMGDLRGALDVINSSVEDHINNCGCNVQCGAALGLTPNGR